MAITKLSIVAIVTRHAGAVDIKFLVDDHPVWTVTPHPAGVKDLDTISSPSLRPAVVSVGD